MPITDLNNRLPRRIISKASCRNHRVIEFVACILQRSKDILPFQIGQLKEDLIMAEACGEQVQHVDHPDAQSADTRSATGGSA